MGTSARAAKYALILMLITFASKILGFGREILVASEFGSGFITDSYFLVYSVVATITAVLNSVYGTTLVPAFVELEETDGKSARNSFMNNIINMSLCLTVILSAAIWIFAPQLVRLLAYGFDESSVRLATELLRIVAPMIIFVAIASIFTAYLQSKEKFIIPASTGFPLNFIYMLYLIMLASRFGIKGFMVAIILAQISTVVFQVPAAERMGYRYEGKLNFKDARVKKILLLTAPVVFGTTLQQINVLIDKSIASRLPTGSISSLSYARKLEELIIGVFIFSLITVLFPMLSSESRKESKEGFKRIMGNGITIVLLITLPVTVGGIILAEPIVEEMFHRGAFDQLAAKKTSDAFIYYLLGLTGVGVRDLLSKVFYSLRDTKAPLLAAAASVLLNIILNLTLVRYMDFKGLALATSISVTLSAAMLAAGLRNKLGRIGGRRLIKNFFKVAVAASTMGAAVWLLKNALLAHYMDTIGGLGLAIIISAGAAIYFSLCYLLKIKEIKYLWHKLYGRLKWFKKICWE